MNSPFPIKGNYILKIKHPDREFTDERYQCNMDVLSRAIFYKNIFTLDKTKNKNKNKKKYEWQEINDYTNQIRKWLCKEINIEIKVYLEK
jgi:hypothetical protein